MVEPESTRDRVVAESVREARDPRSRMALLLLAVLAMALLIGTYIVGFLAYDSLSGQNVATKGDLAAQKEITAQNVQAARDNAEAARRLAQQVKNLGGNPVVDPGDLTPVVGPAGPPGPAPSAAAIQLAVSRWCSSGRCDGRSPTAGDVAAAVARYCNARGECQGPKGDTVVGEKGATGATGATGQTGDTGAVGPPPSDAQVAAAVDSYCASRPDGNCVGASGADGKNGDTWTPTSIVCEQEPDVVPPAYDLVFTFALSDGTEKQIRVPVGLNC